MTQHVQTVAEAVAEELAAAGVDRVFGLPGGEVLYLMEALRRRGIQFVLCRHEANAGIAAAVYGRLKGVPGVALVTLGPGAANLMLAVANSYLDREPLLAISADIPASWPASHTHQRLPLHQVFAPLCKYTAALDGFTARQAVRQALSACAAEPAGVSFLTVSAEDARCQAYLVGGGAAPRVPTGQDGGGFPQEAATAAAAQLRERLERAERPLVLVGMGARPELAGRLRAWLRRWDLPVAVTPKVKGIVDETGERFVGVVGGMAADAVMVEALQSSDLLVGFGFDPVELDKTWHAELPILWVLESPLAAGVVPRRDLLAVNHGDLLEVLLGQDPPRRWGNPFAGTRQRLRELLQAAAGNYGLAPGAVVDVLAGALPPETIVTTDVGSHKYLFGQYWPSRQPRTFFMSNGLSGMGYGVAAALGAKLARPEVPVLAAVGDGGFSMNCQELETTRRVGAPIIVVVLADRSYSLIRLGQQARGLPRHGVDFDPIDTVKVAEACGVQGAVARTPEELADLVAEARDRNDSLVVEVPVDPDAYGPLV